MTADTATELYTAAEVEELLAAVRDRTRDAVEPRAREMGRADVVAGLKALSALNGSTDAVLAIVKKTFDESKYHRNHGKFSTTEGADDGPATTHADSKRGNGGSDRLGGSAEPGGDRGTPAPGAEADAKARTLADRIKEVPAELVSRVGTWVQAKYDRLAARYGPTGAKAVLGAMILLIPTPIPGSSLIPGALAEAVLRIRRAVAPAQQKAAGPLSDEHALALARDLLHDLYEELGEDQEPFRADSHAQGDSADARGVLGSVRAGDAPGSPAKAVAALKARHKYSSTHVPLTGAVADRLRALADSVPDADLADDGREEESHVTIRYGLEVDDSEPVAAIVGRFGPVSLRLGRVSIFPGADSGKDYDVLKVDVESPDLHALHDALAALPHTDTHPSYHPHATICYVKQGLGQKYAEQMGALDADVTADAVVFSDRDRHQTVIPLAAPVGFELTEYAKSLREPAPEHELLLHAVEYARDCAHDGTDPQPVLDELAELADDPMRLRAVLEGTLTKGFDPNEARDEGGKWTAGGAKSESLEPEIRHEALGYSHGQHDLQAVATIDGKTAGVLDYTLYNGELTVKNVEVAPEFRRRGIATRLYDSMLAQHPGATLGRSGMTPDGSAFRAHYNAKHADRLARPAREESPQPHAAEEWERVNAAIEQANGETKERLYDLSNRMNDYDSYALSGRPFLDGRTPERPNVEAELSAVLGFRKAIQWDEQKHPRGKNGRFISVDRIHAAKDDPALAKELRKEVRPEDRQKLEDALSGKSDVGHTARSKKRADAKERRQQKTADRDQARAIRDRLFAQHRAGLDLAPEDLRALVPHLATMSHGELSTLRTFLRGAGVSFGGETRLAERRARVIEWATGEAERIDPTKKLTDSTAGPRRRGKADSVLQAVVDYGGIDPESHDLKRHYTGMRHAQEDGVPLAAFKRGGAGLDALAQELHESGEVRTPEGRDPGEHLLELLRRRALTASADRSAEVAKREEELARGMQQAAVDEFARPTAEEGATEPAVPAVPADPHAHLPAGVRTLKRGIDDSPGLSAEQKAAYHAAVDHVAAHLTPAAQNRLAQNLDGATFHATGGTILEGLKSEAQGSFAIEPEEEKRILAEIESWQARGAGSPGGLYTPALRSVHLDGDTRARLTGRYAADAVAPQIYAHEIGHAIDGPDHELSRTPEWAEAHAREIGSPDASGEHPLTQYAATNSREGFAEFARVLYASDAGTDRVARDFPKASAFFRAHGLWPADRPDAGDPSEVFAGNVATPGGGHLDMLKAPVEPADRSVRESVPQPTAAGKRRRERQAKRDAATEVARPAAVVERARAARARLSALAAAAPTPETRDHLEAARDNTDGTPKDAAAQLAAVWRQAHDAGRHDTAAHLAAHLGEFGAALHGPAPGAGAPFSNRYYESQTGVGPGDTARVVRQPVTYRDERGDEHVVAKGQAARLDGADEKPAPAPQLVETGKDAEGKPVYRNPLPHLAKRPYKYPGVGAIETVQRDESHPVETVDPAQVTSFQDYVKRDNLDRIEGDVKKPVVLVRHGGKLYLEEGNHRAVKAWTDGKKVPAKIIDAAG